MTISEFVETLFDNHRLYTPNDYMTVEDAAYDLEQFRAEGWDFIPDDITPEAYAAHWNFLVKQDAESRL